MMDEGTFEKIVKETIPQYTDQAERIKIAVDGKIPLILDYHQHKPGEPWCFRIGIKNPLAENKPDFIAQLENKKTDSLRDLCHFKHFAKNEKDCKPYMTWLGNALRDFYKLPYTPEIYFQGKPFKG